MMGEDGYTIGADYGLVKRIRIVSVILDSMMIAL